MDGIKYAVIVTYKGNDSLQGLYKSPDSAQRRADSIQGGEVTIMKTMSSDSSEILREFREEKVGEL